MKKVLVGKVLKPQGLQGMVKVLPLVDSGEYFVPGSSLWVGLPDKGYRLMTVEEVTRSMKTVLVRFQGVSSRQLAEGIQGSFLAVEEKELKALPPDHFYYFELIGFKVIEEGELRGEVVAIVEGPSYDYLVVRKEEREYYLPFIYAYVQKVDKRNGFIEVGCPGGFWD